MVRLSPHPNLNTIPDTQKKHFCHFSKIGVKKYKLNGVKNWRKKQLVYKIGEKIRFFGVKNWRKKCCKKIVPLEEPSGFKFS